MLKFIANGAIYTGAFIHLMPQEVLALYVIQMVHIVLTVHPPGRVDIFFGTSEARCAGRQSAHLGPESCNSRASCF